MNTQERIREIREQWGADLIILAHHYQRLEIVDIADQVGDSFELARFASRTDASRIVFCGVHFMAESAAILAGEQQQVYIPDVRSGCPMADMVDLEDLNDCWEMLRASAPGLRCIPIAYMNTSAAVKSFCGAHGGAICTSSNAPQVFQWALSQGDYILFLPDEQLGRNTANTLGIGDSVRLYNPFEPEEIGLSGVKVVVWKGYCHVHTAFTRTHIERARSRWPQAHIVVHPECTPEVVALADSAGSTRFIVDQVVAAGPGSETVIGTEINLIARLRKQLQDRVIMPLDYSLCPNMYRITSDKVLDLLEGWDPSRRIELDPDTRHFAGVALNRMLSLP